MTKTTKTLAALLLLLALPARADVDTVTITGNVTKPTGSSDDALDPCERCEVTVEYVGTNDLTSETLVVTDTPSVFRTDSSGDWTTAPLKLLQGGNYRFRFRDPAWPQAGIFLDVTKTAATCAAPCSATFSSLVTVNVAEGADVSALDHGSISGLGDDDHTIYSKKAAETGYTGTHDFSGATVTGIDYGDLSGVPGSFAPASHTIASHSDTTATGSELETLTDGSDADSLHTHGGLDDWSDSGTVVSIQSGRDLAVGASVSVDNSTGTVDAAAYTVGGTALASTHLSDGATVTNLGDTIEASEISDLNAGTDLTADLEEESHGSEHGEAGGDPIPLSTFELSDLGDVSATSPTSGQALAWNGSAWAPATVTGSVSAADDLSDVAVTTPSSGQILVHDGASDFANVTVSGDATLAANGALSLANNSVDTAEIAAGAVTNTEIAAAAGISLSKIEDSATAGLFLQSGGTGGDPAYGAIVTGDLPSGATLDTEWDTIAELEAATGADIYTDGDGALDEDDLSDDSIDALSDVDTTSSAPTSGQVLKWDGIGDWLPAADDDTPESGDFGAAADLEADGSLSADVVGPAELADGDYGDVSFAAGVISIDTGAVGTDEIATDGVDSAEIAANAVGASELADDAVDLAALSDADYGDWSVALGAATLDANTVGPSELEATAVTPGSYTFTALTVDADGRITAASSGTDDDSPDSDAEVPDAITVGVGGAVTGDATVSIEAAEISDTHAGTDITADLEEEAHASEHESGGADEISVAGLSGQLADAQPTAVHKEGAAATGTRPALNFIDTSPITVTLADDAGNGWVDVTVACPTCSTDSYALSVQEGDTELTGSATALDFGAGFDLTETPTGEANIVLDYTEDPVDLSGSEVTGTLPAASVGVGLTDAQVSDTLTIGSGSTVAAGALPSTVVYENGTHTLSGSFDFSGATITVAGDEWVDADVSNAITVDGYLPLSGGTLTGNVSASAGVTIDGIDLSAINFTDLSGTASDAQIPDTITIDGSANVSNASLQSQVMRTDTTETVASIHTYTAAPDFDITGVPFTMGVGVTGTVTRLDADLLDGEHASAFADASHEHAGEDITSGTVADARIASTLTRDSEWDTAAEINAATTDDDFVTETGTHTVSGTYTLTGSVDAGSGTLEIPNSTTLPATCTVGQQYMDTDATAGQRLYLCESTNTWALQGDGDGGSTTLDVAYNNEGGTGNRAVTVDDGNVKWDLADNLNDYHVVIDNTTTGTQDRGLQIGVSGVGGVITDAIDVSDADIVNALDIGANNITTDAATISSDELEILDNGIDPADLDDGDYGDFSITSGVAALDANVVANAEMADDAIGPAEMADGDFGDFTFSGGVATLDADTVSTSEIATDGVGADEIAANAVGSSEIATDAVGSDEIAAGAVGASEVAADALDFDDFVDAMSLDADTSVALDATETFTFSTTLGDVTMGDLSGGAQDDLFSVVADQALQTTDRVATFRTTGTLSSATMLSVEYANAATTSDYMMTFSASSGTAYGINLSGIGSSVRALNLGANGIYVNSTELSAAEISALDGGIGPTELASADFGDFTVSGGVASLDANSVGASEIATNAVGTLEIDLSISPAWTGNHDFTSGGLEVPHSASLPGTCNVGQSYMDTDADSGARWYLCESTNTWVVQGGAESNDLEGTPPPNVQDDEVFVGTGAAAGNWIALPDSDGATQKLQYDTTTGTFSAGTDDDVPESGDFGAGADLEADGSLSADVVAAAEMADADHGDVSWSGGVATVENLQCTGCVAGSELADADLGDVSVASGSVTLDADVVAQAEMADADHGDISWSGGVASIDSGVVGRSEIDETLLSIQTHATDCTALTCDAGSDGELCLEQDDDQVYACDGSGTPAWVSVGGASTAFGDLTGGTNTAAAMVVGTGASLSATGSGTITATGLADADYGDVSSLSGSITLDADVVAAAEMADADHGDVSWSGGVATVENLQCSTCVDLASEVTGTLPDANVANDLTLAGGTIGTSSLTLVQSTAPTPTAEGRIEWETDDDHIIVGDGTAAVEFVPAEDVSGDVTMTDDGVVSLSNDVVAAAEMADADHGDVSWSGGVATVENLQCTGCVAGSELADADLGDVSVSSGSVTIDAAVVGRSEIDETLLSAQTHATDCTALTCDAGSDGEMCFEQDDDAWYVCDGSGTPAWAAIGGGATGFDAITTGTNTTATMTVGTGASLAASGSGSITATAVEANAVALSTGTTGNYVATVADAGNGTVSVSGSGSEGAAVTLDVVDVNCTDCLGTTEIADSYVLNAGDTMTGNLTLDDGVTDSPSIFLTSASSSYEIVNDWATNLLVVAGNSTGTTGVFYTNDGTGGASLTVDGRLAIQAKGVETGAVYAAGAIGVGSSLSTGAACIAENGSDRIFHDADCDETKDSGEEWIDVNSRTEENCWRSDVICQTVASGGATLSTADESATNQTSWGRGFDFLNSADSSITCIVPLPSSFDATGSVQVQVRGHASSSPSGGDVDFEIRVKEIAAGENYATAFGSYEATAAGELDVTLTSSQPDYSNRSGWFTVTETLVADDEFIFQLTRDANDATHDDSSDTFRLDTVCVKWTEILE